jgi:hypothetical protein
LAVRRGWSQLLFSDFENGWGNFTTYSSPTAETSYYTIDCAEADDWGYEYCSTFERADSNLRGACCYIDDDATAADCWNNAGCEYDSGIKCYYYLRWSGPQNGDHTDGGGHYLYAKANNKYDKPYTQYLESSFAGGEAGGTVQFWCTMWSASYFPSNMGNLPLEAFDGAVWSCQWGKEGYQSAEWLDASVPVVGNISKIRFVASVQFEGSDIAIDDVSVFVAPTPSPSPIPPPSPLPTPAPSPYPALTIVPPKIVMSATKPDRAQALL